MLRSGSTERHRATCEKWASTGLSLTKFLEIHDRYESRCRFYRPHYRPHLSGLRALVVLLSLGSGHADLLRWPLDRRARGKRVVERGLDINRKKCSLIFFNLFMFEKPKCACASVHPSVLFRRLLAEGGRQRSGRLACIPSLFLSSRESRVDRPLRLSKTPGTRDVTKSRKSGGRSFPRQLKCLSYKKKSENKLSKLASYMYVRDGRIGGVPRGHAHPRNGAVVAKQGFAAFELIAALCLVVDVTWPSWWWQWRVYKKESNPVRSLHFNPGARSLPGS